MTFYERSKLPIRITYIAFGLLAIGFLIQNKNVNLFYTFKNTFVLSAASFCYKLGQIIIVNLPLIFMTNNVCKKANSGGPIILALVGYFTFLITTMFFAKSDLQGYAYTQSSGINTIISTNGIQMTKFPLETGLIGSFIVAYCVRFSFVKARYRSRFSALSFLGASTTSILYTIFLCLIAGIVCSFVFPILYEYLQMLEDYISKDLMSPIRIGIYGIFDRLLSLLGLGNAIRYPFWYTAAGGSYSTTAGTAILGDVAIWEYIQGASTTFAGAGRFITPYYVINMFVIPGVYIGMLFSMSDRYERRNFIFPLVVLSAFSIIAGNPLPLELLLLFTAPLLLLFYLIEVGFIFGLLVKLNTFLGFVPVSKDTVTAMPGSFPDYIINLRNTSLQDAMGTILIVGIISLVIMTLITMLYFRYLSYDVIGTGKCNALCDKIVEAMSGTDNIIEAGSGFLRVNIYLNDIEKADFDKVRALGAKKIRETKGGFAIDFGASSYKIAKRINKVVEDNRRV